MAVVAATLKEATLVAGNENQLSPARKTYRFLVQFGTMTAGDTWAMVTAGAKLATVTKQGKTVTLRAAAAGQAGSTPGGTAAYALDATVSGTTLSGSVGTSTAAAAVASGTTASVYVTVDES